MKKALLISICFFLTHCNLAHIQHQASFVNLTNPESFRCIYLHDHLKADIEKTLNGELKPLQTKESIDQTLKKILPEGTPFSLKKDYSNKWIAFLNHFEKYKRDQKNQNKIKLKESITDLKDISKKLNLYCINKESQNYFIENNSWDINFFKKIKKTNTPSVYGAKKVMSTIYQSCDVVTLPTISIENALDIQGIKKIKRHSQGGWKRQIVDKKKLYQSHYYTKHYKTPLCHNVEASPLIYDFGGKPSFSEKPLPVLNFFNNHGSGSNDLGIDCSGFVFSALATAGLRLKPNQKIKLSDVLNAGAFSFKDTKRFSCLERSLPSYSSPFQEGDIVTHANHVFIVDTVFDNDPFSLESISDYKSCSSLKVSDFNFVVIQSSPSIGINRMHIREFDSSNYYSSIKNEIKKFATSVCLEKFNKKSSHPSQLSVTRHKGTLECLEEEVYLKNQECLKHCELQ